ncbi:unnamed protein product [Rotaria sp. Silwood1]|nr:unnamed protein product [Rotaria sp. Silwood1]CAF1593718.1 unnamed protein product [Rotaria sp. Silwood1]CAF1595000.1 unnamed protein product [Rotaria sp. Silwood1]CAF3709045.1 unnamed protein product [Rotaria sp. Silwood1]CAF3714002.1 unnamed protein product [Rotaria sp. Silwood1]
MSSTNNSNSIPLNTTTENELDDLVSQLRKKINQSDWLTHNTSAKWEQENPELAKQWREAIKIQPTNNSTEQ